MYNFDKSVLFIVYFVFIGENDFLLVIRWVNSECFLKGLFDIWWLNFFGIIGYVDRVFGCIVFVGWVVYFEVFVVWNFGGFVGNNIKNMVFNWREVLIIVYISCVDFLLLFWLVVLEV